LGDFEGKLGNGDSGRGKSNFFQLRQNRRRTHRQKENHKKGDILHSHIASFQADLFRRTG
jgi:hypothetical protein